MAAYKNKKTGTWFIQCRNPVTGKNTTIRRNPRTGVPFPTKKAAKEYELYYLSNKIDISMTLDQLKELYVNDYLSLKPSPSDRSVLSWYKSNIEGVLGKRKIVTLRVRDLENLAHNMKQREYSVGYINKMCTLISTMLNWAVSHGYLENNGTKNFKPLKEPRTSDKLKYFTPEQFKQIIEAIPEVYPNGNQTLIRQVLAFAYLTGLRKSEIRALQWNNIDWERNIIHVDYHYADSGNVRKPGRKNGDAYSIYMDKNVSLLMEEIYDRYKNVMGFHKDAYVFPSERSGFDKALGDHTPTRWVQKLSEYCNIQNPTFHGLRHSFCSYATSVCNLSPYAVANKLGDSVLVTINTYTDFFNDQKIETAKILDQHSDNLSFLIEEKKEDEN